MENKKKKDLAKIALAAFIVSASLPAVGNASFKDEIQGTYLAGFGCHGRNGCAAASNSREPAYQACGSIDPSRNGQMQQRPPQGTPQRLQQGNKSTNQQPNSSKHAPGIPAKGAVAFEETQWEVSPATPRGGQRSNSSRNAPVAAADEREKPQAGVMESEGSSTQSKDSQRANSDREGSYSPSGSGMQMERR